MRTNTPKHVLTIQILHYIAFATDVRNVSIDNAKLGQELQFCDILDIRDSRRVKFCQTSVGP